MGLKIHALYGLTPEFDYLKLIELLKTYSHPRDQITKLIKSKEIIRVKKGIYVLGPEFHKPHSLEILANIIYGPSYLSGASALAFYNLIPERVSVTSSRTPCRNKVFDTPVGRFIYDLIAMRQYQVSVNQIHIDSQRSFLIATQEKSIVELYSKIKGIDSSADLLDWIDSMRIDTDVLARLRISELNILGSVFNEEKVNLLIELVRKAKGNA